jgi:hypothetical protein
MWFLYTLEGRCLEMLKCEQGKDEAGERKPAENYES